MSRFHGPQAGHKTDRGNRRNGPKGVMRQHRQILREEAEARQVAYDAEHKDDVTNEGEELAAELIEEEVKGKEKKHGKGKDRS